MRRDKIRFSLLASFLLALTTPSTAEEPAEENSGAVINNPYVELDDETFDDEFDEVADFDSLFASGEEVETNAWSRWLDPAYFTLRQEFGYGLKDPQSLVINRASLRLQWQEGFAEHYFVRFDAKADYDAVYNRSEYADLKDDYRQQTRVREFYLQRSEGDFSAKLGRQLVIWGKADSGVVSDIFSPRDLTESVFTSVEDARLGQDMLVTDWFFQGGESGDQKSQYQLSLIVNPDIKYNLLPKSGHPYGPEAGTNLVFPEQSDSGDYHWSEPELGFRLARTLGSLDLSLMLADVVANDADLFVDSDNTGLHSSKSPEDYRYQMLAGGFNWGQGKFVWKGELAFKRDRPLQSIDSPSLFVPAAAAVVEKNVVDAAIGFDFNDNGLYLASLELSHRYIDDWKPQLQGTRRRQTAAYFVLSKQWRNDTLTTEYTSMYQFQDKEAFHRLGVSYQVNDFWTLAVQGDYFSTRTTQRFLGSLSDKHRLSVKIDYQF